MQEPTVQIDDERQQKAREYSRIQRRLMLVDLVIGALYLIVVIAAGWHTSLRAAILSRIASPFLNVLIFALALGLPYSLLDLPLSFFSGYVLPHRFEQSNQTLGGWIVDLIKSLALSGILGGILLSIVYWLLRAAPELWWLYAGGVMLFFTVVISALNPVLFAPLFYKFIPLDDDELASRLTVLAEQSGIEVTGVYRFDLSTRTKSANAAVIGLGTTRRIILGDTLLESFTYDEIETVLAHEFAHIVHKDMPLSLVINSGLTLISLWAVHLVLRWGAAAFDLTGIADPAGMPVFALTVGVISLIAMPLGNAFSRWRERMADQYALEHTGKPQSFADAMVRLANQNLGEINPERWEVVLLHSHPPLAERIAFAEGYKSTKE
ncbi:MAG: M48 family metallopeptidase [Anaerolineae bacterium]|nr:M48 family metallopeptidase [Anaerolineae bacterium]